MTSEIKLDILSIIETALPDITAHGNAGEVLVF
jgi:hypothetical protein